MMRFVTIVFCLCISGAAVAANSERALSYVAKAERDISNNDWDNAFIEIKNAIQQDSKNGRARYLAGMITLHNGDYAIAENHFRSPQESGYNPAEVEIGLAEVHVKQERYGEVLDDIQPGDRRHLWSPGSARHAAMPFSVCSARATRNNPSWRR